MKHYFAALLILVMSSGFAQEAKKFNKAFYKEVTFETDDYKMYLVKCFSEKDILRIKLRIFNKTKDYILIKPAEFVINMGGEALKIESNPVVVQPDGDEAKNFEVKRAGSLNEMRQDAFEVVLNGFYKIPVDGEVLVVPSTTLPGKVGSEMIVGPFKCKYEGDNIKAKVAKVDYHCFYTGDKIGIIDATKAEGILANGNKVKNASYAGAGYFLKTEGMIVEKGIERAFHLDFKFNNTGNFDEGLSAKWNETFKESKLVPYKVIKVPMQLDLEKSEK